MRLATFLETPRFPECISAGSTGGPAYRTDIIELESGHEQRNVRWSQGRHTFNAAIGVRSLDHFEQLRAFFHVVAGRGYGFRFQDPHDYKSAALADVPQSTDQVIGTGDGALTDFQLVKRYVVGAFEYVRTIRKPVDGSVLVAVAGADVTATVDATTGIVTLPAAPAVGEAVSAGFEFDVPVRFGEDAFEHAYEHYLNGSAEVTLVELRKDAA